ncbi:MAG: D-2-hydroxyacid dehydrogenase [Erysipelotrichaceae bacterium]|nr:D-2-hydroxyacid dehydrogenase [Erysipelotrichaceae bacterium]
MNIVILDAYTLNPGDLSWEKLEALGNLTIYDRTPIDQIVFRAQEADILLTNKTPLNAETLRQLTRTKYIGVLATGYNVVDVQEATCLNITVTNVPDYGTNAVAQHVFALLLELTSHVGHHNQQVQQGRWSQSSDFCFWDFPLLELYGKTFGVYGYGRIGKATAKIAVAFGMNVLAYDHDRIGQDGDIEKVDLETFLKKCDIISLHVPLTSQTRHIINESSIEKMKDGVMLINTSRGPLIDEIALRDALLSQKVKAAGLDVASVEPIGEDYPLLGLENCILTPHIAWAPIEARQRLLEIVLENLNAYLHGKPVNKVNP